MSKTNWISTYGARLACTVIGYLCFTAWTLPVTHADTLQQAYLKASNTTAGDNFGWVVAISGNTAVVGAREAGSDADDIESFRSNSFGKNNQKYNFGERSGVVYVFTRSGSSWVQQATLRWCNVFSVNS